MGIFYWEKNQENDFAPSEKYACYAPGWDIILLSSF